MNHQPRPLGPLFPKTLQYLPNTTIICEKRRRFGGKDDYQMRQLDYSKLADRTWDNEIISYISKIHEFKGKQELFLRQKPVELNRLIDLAKVQSTEASNRIEGIITTNSRLKQLVADKTTPKNRDEEEILGYRNVLNLIHESYDAIPVNRNYILQLHKELLKYVCSQRGQRKRLVHSLSCISGRP